jgi:hypothetical protein
MPASFSFSRQSIPTPDLPDQGVNAQGLSRQQQDFSLDWRTDFRQLPSTNLHYARNSYLSHYPKDMGGDTSSRTQDLSFDAQYTLAHWNLNSTLSRSTSSSDTPGFLSLNGESFSGRSESRAVGVSAGRSLPLRSRLLLDFGTHDTTIAAGESGSISSYARATANLSSRVTDRLSTSAQSSYISSASDYARQQVLRVTTSEVNTLSPLANMQLGLLSYGAGASYRLTRGLSAHGSFSAGTLLTTVAHAGTGDNLSVAGGVGYQRALFNGKFASSYDVTRSLVHLGAAADTVLAHTVSASYARQIPWRIWLNSSGDGSVEQVRYTYSDLLRSYGVNFDATRRVSSSWDVRARFSLRSQAHDFPARQENGNRSVSLSAISRRLQVNFGQQSDSGLAYQFGGGFVLVPGAAEAPLLAGLPSLVLTFGRTTHISALYSLNKRMRFRGSYRQGARSVNDAETLATRGYDLRFEYKMRRLAFAAGYSHDRQQFTRSTSISFFSRYFYAEVRRDFRLF